VIQRAPATIRVDTVLQVLVDPVAERYAERRRALQLERRHAVERASRALRGVAQSQHGGQRRAGGHEALLIGVPHLVRPVRVHPPDPSGGMLHEITADLIAAIADALRFYVVGGEQQARVLDCAAGEHVMARLHLPCVAIERTHHDVANRARARVGLYVDRIGVQDDAHVGRLEEVLRARRAEALALFVEAPQARGEPIGVEGMGHDTQRGQMSCS
jgi:hypothetical protein